MVERLEAGRATDVTDHRSAFLRMTSEGHALRHRRGDYFAGSGQACALVAFEGLPSMPG